MENAPSTEIKNDDKLKKWLLLVPAMLAAFLFTLDETIANIALPHMAGAFSVSRQESIWILTSYLIASCITIPMIDWLTRLMGRKNMFMFMVLLFTAASFLCGISSSIGMMVIARFLQGLGGGVLMPVSQAIVMETFKGRELSLAVALFGLVVIIAPIIGPVLGGWITENWSWHWIFFINLPVGGLILVLAQSMIYDPDYAKKQKNVHTDWLGIIFLFVFAAAFEIMMDKGNDLDWFNSSFVCRLTMVWVLALTGFIVSQLYGKNTLVNLKVLKDWNLAAGTLALTVLNAVLLGSLAIIPQFMQLMMGYDSFTSGLSMMPRGIGCIIGLLAANSLMQKIDGRYLALAGVLILCIGSWTFGNINLQISQSAIITPNILYGIGMALAMVPLITISCRSIRAEDMSNASGLQNFIKTIGGAAGTSLVATFISRFSQTHQNMLVHNLTETNPVFLERLQTYAAAIAEHADPASALDAAYKLIYSQLLQQSRLLAYVDSFRIYAVMGLIIAVILLVMKSDIAGRHESKQKNNK